MKNIFLLLFFTIISTTSNAENDQHKSNTVNSSPILTKNEANNLHLWNLLDTNKDESISKTEALCAKEIIDRWDELDSNKDGKLDFMDFSRLSNHKT